MAVFYVVRHGQTDWNKERKIQGHTDICLNEEGKKEARALAEKFKEISFAFCLSSDLKRCLETAHLSSITPIIIDARLRERNFKDWEGKMASDYLSALPEEREKTESDASLKLRIFEVLQEYANYEGNILIVTHGGVLRMLLKELLFLDSVMQSIQSSNTACIKINAVRHPWTIEHIRGICKIR